jgi:glycyl-tRNA synthetase beta chain
LETALRAALNHANFKPLLIEIGVEELPAAPLNKESNEIAAKYDRALKSRGIESEFEFNFTPRRFVFFHEKFPEKLNDKVEVVFGPPVEGSFANGSWSNAAIGFAKKCGVEVEKLSKTTQKNKEVFCYEKVVAAKPIADVLSVVLDEFLRSLNLGKTMRWDAPNAEFTRPVRYLAAILENEIVKGAEVFGVKASDQTFAHRSKSFEPQKIGDIKSYEKFLEDRGVILSADRRKQIILEQFKTIETKHNFTIEIDEELLAEVVAITEFPTAIAGKFDERFLELPKEVIITSMKANQRYFAVFKNGAMVNNFVAVSNALANDFAKITAGNEKVLRPRLADALFFYRNDLKNGLNPEPLKKITFMQELGTIYEKQEREAKIAELLCGFFGADFNDKETSRNVERAAMLSKCDLASEMVYEFPELQGVMGMRYAEKLGENAAVARVIAEQYMPLGENLALPRSEAGAILAIAAKLDSLMALFSIGLIPSGSKDPFALRRAAAGIIRIAIDRGWAFSLSEDFFKNFADHYKDFDLTKLSLFFRERLNGVMGANPSVINAVLAAGEKNLVEISRKVSALETLANRADFRENFAVFKRVANILKDTDTANCGDVNPAIFETNEERDLHTAFNAIGEIKEYAKLLESLFNLRDPLANFFDAVMVNADDQKIRLNRVALIAAIYNKFLAIADIKEIGI